MTISTLHVGRAGNIGKTANIPNCGGPKKGGLAPSVGWLRGTGLFLMRRSTNTQFGLCCIGNYSNPSQQAAKRARIGMMI